MVPFSEDVSCRAEKRLAVLPAPSSKRIPIKNGCSPLVIREDARQRARDRPQSNGQFLGVGDLAARRLDSGDGDRSGISLRTFPRWVQLLLISLSSQAKASSRDVKALVLSSFFERST